MAEIGWGQLQAYEAYGRAGDKKEDYDIVSYKEALSDKYSTFKHASHSMLFARNDAILWDLYTCRGAVLMQMRFDGLLGFPGGLVDPGEHPLQSANRELEEEIGLDLTKCQLSDSDHVVSFVNKNKKLVLHFYGKEVTLSLFQEIELGNLKAPDYGSETLGIIRPPLFTMGDGYRGLPAFLSNSFAGNARQEFLIGLQHYKLLSESEIQEAVKSWLTFQIQNENSSS
ncbi:U8 snoRNA-decapping enzyme-like [Crassostrea virginica]